MALPSNNLTNADRGVILQNPQWSITSSGGGGGGSESSGSSFTGITDPAIYELLMKAIQDYAGGGTSDYKAQRAQRNAEIDRTRTLSGDYSKSAAFSDAAALMAENLRKSLEANMPSISKAIQGAGTSASSMQGLLSQKLANESAQAASALGAEQAKSYGNISAQLQSILEALTRPDNSNGQILAQLLGVAKTSSQSQRSSTQPTNPIIPGESGGGGSYFQPFGQDIYQSAIQQAIQGYGQGSTGQGQGYIVNNDTGAAQVFTPQGIQDYQVPTSSSYFDYGPSAQDLSSFLDQQYAEGWGYGD